MDDCPRVNCPWANCPVTRNSIAQLTGRNSIAQFSSTTNFVCFAYLRKLLKLKLIASQRYRACNDSIIVTYLKFLPSYEGFKSVFKYMYMNKSKYQLKTRNKKVSYQIINHGSNLDIKQFWSKQNQWYLLWSKTSLCNFYLKTWTAMNLGELSKLKTSFFSPFFSNTNTLLDWSRMNYRKYVIFCPP